jgi:hypothetical protein
MRCLRFLLSPKTIFILIFSFINYSCSSYNEISKEGIQKRDHGDVIKLLLKDQSNIVARNENIKFNNRDSLLIISKGTENRVIKLSEIEKFTVLENDTSYTIIYILGLIGGAAIIYLLVKFLGNINFGG